MGLVCTHMRVVACTLLVAKILGWITHTLLTCSVHSLISRVCVCVCVLDTCQQYYAVSNTVESVTIMVYYIVGWVGVVCVCVFY